MCGLGAVSASDDFQQAALVGSVALVVSAFVTRSRASRRRLAAWFAAEMGLHVPRVGHDG